MNASVASVELIAIDVLGKRFPLRVSIGTPYLSKDDVATWFCPVSINPLYEHLPDIAGVDALQALCLAIHLAFDLLRSFVAKGGRLTYDGEHDLLLDSYFFGTTHQ